MADQKARIRILRRSQVFGPTGCTGLSTSSGYELIAKGLFPRPVPLSDVENARAVGWLDFEIENWIESRVAAREARAHRVADLVAA